MFPVILSCDFPPLSICHYQSQDAHHLHYAALNLKKSTKQHHQEENVDNVCVYSRVKSRKV